MSNAIEIVIDPRPRDLGGFSVRRLLPYAKRRSVGPFVFFDHLGPASLPAGRGVSVRPHPHIGLATVTWLYSGALMHRDSLGTVQTIRPGEVNWMTAGKGITHSERTPPDVRAKGHMIEAIQTWVALPQDYAEQEPAFAHHAADSLPELNLPGAVGRLIAGEAFGERSPVEFPSGICQLSLEATGECLIETPDIPEACVHVVRGSAVVDGHVLGEAQMAVLHPGRRAMVQMQAGDRIMIAGGDPLDGPRLLDWNFVASSKDRLEKAVADWRESIERGFEGSWFTEPPGETSYIPYPGDAQPDPEDSPPD
ncbi:MAG: pirin family protein [Hyphomonadaceae bacterium]